MLPCYSFVANTVLRFMFGLDSFVMDAATKVVA